MKIENSEKRQKFEKLETLKCYFEVRIYFQIQIIFPQNVIKKFEINFGKLACQNRDY